MWRGKTSLPPTYFGSTHSAFNQQSFSTTIRNIAEPDVTAEERRKSSEATGKDADKIRGHPLSTYTKFSENLTFLTP